MSTIINADTSGGLKLTSDTSGQLELQSAGSTKVTMDTSGNVGIGTASPTSNLDVVNSSASGTGAVTTIRLNHPGTTAGDGPKLLFTSGSSTTGGCAIAGAGQAVDSANMVFYAGGNTERMRMLNSGQVVVGGASWVGGSTDSGLQIDMNTSTSATFGLIVRNGSNAESFIHKMNGSTYNTTGTFGSISDRRFKENIVDATSKLEEVKQLQVRNFNLIGEEEKYLGFIAQEIEQVFPNIVDTQAERTYEETDDDGNETTVTTPEKKLVKTTVLIPILTKALQEAVTKIEDLETRIQALENA